MGPRVVSWLINPTNCSYKHHKPYKHWSYLHQLSFLGFPLYIYIYTCIYGDRYWFAKVSSSWFDPLETKRAKISGICAGFHPNACVYIYIYLSMCLCIYIYRCTSWFKKKNYFYTKKTATRCLISIACPKSASLFSPSLTMAGEHSGGAVQLHPNLRDAWFFYHLLIYCISPLSPMISSINKNPIFVGYCHSCHHSCHSYGDICTIYDLHSYHNSYHS